MSWQSVVRVVVVAVAVFAAAAAIRTVVGLRDAAWEDRVERVELVSGQLSSLAHAAVERARAHAARADSSARVAVIHRAQVREQVAVERAADVPDTCAAVVARRDELIDAALVNADEWEAAYRAEVEAGRAYAEAERARRVAQDSLLAVLQARPRPRSFLIPEVRPYVGVGTSPAGRIEPQVGVGFTWRVR